MEEVKITPLHVAEVKVDIKGVFNGGLLPETFDAKYHLRKPSEDNEVLLVLISFAQISKDEFSDFSFEIGCSWTFSLYPRIEVSQKEVYECLKYIQTYLSEITNAIFSKQEPKVEIRIPSLNDEFEDISAALEEALH